jgi:hypothetical protein
MKELLQREAEITRRWLKLKGIGPEFAKEAMVKACQDWFGIGIQNVVYRPDRKAAEVERLSQHFIGGDGRIDNGLFRTFQEIGQEELLNEALVKEFRDKDEEKKSSEEKESGSGSKKPSLSQGKSQDSDVQMSRSSSASQATSPGTSIQQPRGATHVQSGLNAQSASAKRIRLEKEPDNSGDRGRGRG